MVNLYTSLQEATEELKKRWEDPELRKKVADFLSNDIPDFFQDKPHLVLFKNIMTPNDENRRLIKMHEQTGVDFLGLEFTNDKFVTFNLDKYMFGKLFFDFGTKNNGNLKTYKRDVLDLDEAQGKKFSELKTLWGEGLVDFHHRILLSVFPQFKGKVYDMSDWVNRNGGRARLFYEKLMGLLICHCVLVENFQMNGEKVPHPYGNKDESDFTSRIVLPAFEKAFNYFGVKPLIVQLAPEDYKNNPAWWYYRPELKETIEKSIDSQLSPKAV